MKKRERSIEVADLDAIAHVGEDIVLFFDSEDEIIPTSLCVEANFYSGHFGPVQPMYIYMQSNTYQPIRDPDTRISQRQRILEEMDPDMIGIMLKEFTQKLLFNLDKPDFLNSTEWVPGG